MIRAGIITGYGINADRELAEAFEAAGAQANFLPLGELMRKPQLLRESQIVAFPGGFSFGDHLGSGQVLGQWVRSGLREELDRHLAGGGLTIGICNGFQVLVKMGYLPNLQADWTPEVTLVHNESGRFQNRWVRVEYPSRHCVWTQGLPEMDLPIRHGEGRFQAPAAVLDRLVSEDLVAVRYLGDNPNGSALEIAGITDSTGRILGLMPHPEAFVRPLQHPRKHRDPQRAENTGLKIFQRAVDTLKGE